MASQYGHMLKSLSFIHIKRLTPCCSVILQVNIMVPIESYIVTSNAYLIGYFSDCSSAHGRYR